MKALLLSVLLMSPMAAQASSSFDPSTLPGFVNQDALEMKSILVYGGARGVNFRLRSLEGFSVCEETTPTPIQSKADFTLISRSEKEATVYLKRFKDYRGLRNTCRPNQAVILEPVMLQVVSELIHVKPHQALTIIAPSDVLIEESIL